MKPLHLRAANFRTFQELDLDFPTGAVAIVGPNGAGKSSLVMLPDLALFGAESRSLAPYLSDDAIGDLMIELTFEHDGHLYRVRRGYSANGRGKASADFEQRVNGIENGHGLNLTTTVSWEPLTLATIKETDALICQTIGMTRDTYRASAYLAQGDGSFADPAWDPKRRKELLFTSLGLDAVWTPLLDRARADKHAVNAQLLGLVGRTDALEAEIAGKVEAASRLLFANSTDALATQAVTDAEKTVTTAQAKVTEAEKDESRRREYAARLKSAETTWQALEEIDGLANISQVQLAELEPMIAEREQVVIGKASAETLVAQLKSELQESSREERAQEAILKDRTERVERISSRQAVIADLYAKALAAENAAGRVGSGDVTTCQTCGQEIADKAAEKVREGYLAETAAHRESAASLEQEQIEDHPEAASTDVGGTREIIFRIREDVARFTEELASREAIVRDAQAAEVSLASLNAQAASYREHIAKAQAPGHDQAKQAAEIELQAARDAVASVGEAVDLDALKRAAESASHSLTAAQSTARTAHEAGVRAEAELERIAKAEVQLAESAKDREALDAEHDLLCQLERAYGRDGIPALIVENSAIPAIEDEANRILAELHTDYRVELRTQRELKSGDGLADTLDVVILTDLGERPYESFSGGERSRINVALRIALARLLAHRRGAESRALLLDEIEYLDDDGLAALAEILRGLQGEFDLILIVSHAAGLRDAFDQVIEITKDGNRSEVAS